MNTASGQIPDDEEGELVVNDRTCIVTRESGSPDRLIRFVAGPDGTIIPDLKRKLPGRGCWVTIDRALVAKAVEKRLFARALKKDVKAGPELVELIDKLLVEDLSGMMHLARKAGQFVTGSMKVDQAVRSGEAIAVMHASDAAADGVRKIDQARKAFHMLMETESEIPSFRLFASAELDMLMGENSFIHAAVLAGNAGEGVVKRAKLLVQYREGMVSAGAKGMGLEKQ